MLGKTPWEIVGVVDDVRQGALDTEPDPQFFVDFRQVPDGFVFFPDPSGVYFAVRANASTDPIASVPSIRGLIAQIEPRAALDAVFGMEQLVSTSMARPRFYATLLALFALIAATLAIVGIYGVLACIVTQRTHEIGIRIALGAQRADVLCLVLGQGARLTVAGIVLGLIAAFTVTRSLASMLFGLTPHDPATFLVVAVTFAVTALLATYVPARRAMEADPRSSLSS
jgi:ABC-type antimicrobial peptide transport system permease subunit